MDKEWPCPGGWLLLTLSRGEVKEVDGPPQICASVDGMDGWAFVKMVRNTTQAISVIAAGKVDHSDCRGLTALYSGRSG